MIGEQQETAVGLKYKIGCCPCAQREWTIYASVLIQLLLYVIRFTLFITSV